jgi:predicted nucleic acid-binding protein
MPDAVQLVYWDACVFLNYINGTLGRVDVLATLLDEVEQSDGSKRIVTSVLSKVEVAFASREKDKRVLDPLIEEAIDFLWADKSVIELVELHDEIARLARTYLRYAVANGYKLKPPDAIHMATAQWVGACELHTYNVADFKRFESLIDCKVCEPYAQQPRLLP